VHSPDGTLEVHPMVLGTTGSPRYCRDVRRLALALAIATATALGAAPADAAVPAPKVVRYRDNGSTVRLVPGQELRIRLGICSGCGEDWKVRRAPSKLVLTRLEQGEDHDECGLGCVPGNQFTIFRYRAKAPGTTRLKLASVYDGEVDGFFRLRVRVRS
jgi:predicted secreted protein